MLNLLRSLALATTAIVAMVPAARAADAFLEEAQAPMPAPLAPSSPVYVWSGPYAGAFVGYNTSNFDQSGGASFDGEGFVGGVYTGYNWQADEFVYGLEADIGGSGVDADGTNTGARIDADTDIFGSFRARAGVAVDPFLVFATGGVAAARNELSLNGFSDSQTSIGYTLGAGVEARITDNVTSRLEYRYSDFGSETYDLGNTSVSSGFDEHSIRAGVALKF
ncbi:outer membrane protein [Aurantimonas sp. A2-1-M11]|uniref:outer membrane protein n=1 Tax=Aurantimonas sp. A2-1-M11 TaxID=3113712 RepID=UPI002F94F456